jgi:hypothetical protein
MNPINMEVGGHVGVTSVSGLLHSTLICKLIVFTCISCTQGYIPCYMHKPTSDEGLLLHATEPAHLQGRLSRMRQIFFL